MVGLARGNGLETRLSTLLTIHYTAMGPRLNAWHLISETLHAVTIGGLAVFLWRLVNPRDTTRFVIP